MPHFIAKSHNYRLPFKHGDFYFEEEYIHETYPDQSLILCHYKNTSFFIKKTSHQKGLLFKAEKITRPTSTGILKSSLKILAQYCDLLSDNLAQNSPRQENQSPYVLNLQSISTFDFNNLSLEIGFGSGRHLLDLALKSPQSKFLGIEIHTPSLEQVHRQIKLLNLKNLYLTKLDARILTNFIPSNSCECIFLHFPVPWNKKPHRRVLTQPFLNEALRILKPQSFLHLRTDDEIYFKDAISLGLSHHQTRLTVQKNLTHTITSKYEARWQKQQKNIYDLLFYSLQKNPNICFEHHFSLPYPSKIPEPQKSIQNDFFLHIHQRFFGKDSIIISLSFGDFNWPNAKFIIIDHKTKKTSFIGAAPLAIPANIKAHQTLIQILGE